MEAARGNGDAPLHTSSEDHGGELIG
jgi:hypothetical protein